MGDNYTSMPFAGIPTFLKAPFVDEPENLPGGSIGVIGVPLDEATTNRPGARFGPRAIREASTVYSYWEGGRVLDRGRGRTGFYDIECGHTILSDVKMADAGDVPISPADIAESLKRITASIGSLCRAGVFPVVLGGDHSITYPVIRGFTGTEDRFWVLQLDSHLDYLDELDGSRYTHASPMRLTSGLEFVDSIFHCGMRGILADEDMLEDAVAGGGKIVTTETILRDGTDSLFSQMPGLEKCYVTVDIDVFDPSIAPGTGVPEPGGLGFRDVRAILSGVAEKYQIIGFDIVEVNPLFDHGGITAQLAARTAIDFLGAIYSNKRG